MNAVNSVVRVSVLNNFNCTDKEFKQLDGFVKDNPDKFFFINSNVNTPRLSAINDHPYKTVITFNPNISFSNEKEGKRLSTVKKNKVAFVRVKYVPDHPEILKAIQDLSDLGYTMVVTVQRFNKKTSVTPYGIMSYKFSHSRYRLTENKFAELCEYVDTFDNVHICDRIGLGCQGCGMCSTLTLGEDKPISSLNLSTSGICPFSCPDCYAKQMQKFTVGCGYAAIDYNKIKMNEKQKGKTAHILEARKAA